MDVFRDQASALFVAVITLFVGVIIAFLQRKKKAITYEVISRDQLLTISEEIEGKLQVLYEGQVVRDIRLFVVMLKNTGNVAITIADYERPLSILTGSSSKILSAVITEVNPASLKLKIHKDDKQVELERVLLNAGDSIKIKLLVSDSEENIIVDGRVVDVRVIKDAGKISCYDPFVVIGSVVCLTVGAFWLILNSPGSQIQPNSSFANKVAAVLVILGYFGMLYFLPKSQGFRLNLRLAIVSQLKKWRLIK